MHDELVRLLLPIVVTEFPEEIEEFKEYADGFIHLAFKDNFDSGTNDLQHSEFCPVTQQTSPSSISLLLGVIMTFEELRKRKVRRDRLDAPLVSGIFAFHLHRLGFGKQRSAEMSAGYLHHLREIFFNAEQR